jgi:hypothetical protein
VLAMLRLLPVLRDPSVALKEQLWNAASWHSQEAGHEKGGAASSSSSLRAEEVLAHSIYVSLYFICDLCEQLLGFLDFCICHVCCMCSPLFSKKYARLTFSFPLSFSLRCGEQAWKCCQAPTNVWRV